MCLQELTDYCFHHPTRNSVSIHTDISVCVPTSPSEKPDWNHWVFWRDPFVISVARSRTSWSSSSAVVVVVVMAATALHGVSCWWWLDTELYHLRSWLRGWRCYHSHNMVIIGLTTSIFVGSLLSVVCKQKRAEYHHYQPSSMHTFF